MIENVLRTWQDGGALLLPLAALSIAIWWLFLAGRSTIHGQRDAETLAIAGRNLLLLRACTAAAPLLGLLGTVMGMIQTFDAMSGESGLGFDGMAGGIGTALITTQFGLIAALPGLFGVVYLSRACRRLRLQLEVNA